MKINPIYVIFAGSAAALMVPFADPLIQGHAKFFEKSETSRHAWRDMMCEVDHKDLGHPEKVQRISADVNNDTCVAILDNGKTLSWEWSIAKQARDKKDNKPVSVPAVSQTWDI